MMKVDAKNIRNTDLNECLHFSIRLIGKSTRRGSNLTFEGKENCSGHNINKYIFDGMTVNQYQNMIKANFNPNDPQFSLTKHLKYDIEKGFIELVR